jgi:hypothetical protein
MFVKGEPHKVSYISQEEVRVLTTQEEERKNLKKEKSKWSWPWKLWNT